MKILHTTAVCCLLALLMALLVCGCSILPQGEDASVPQSLPMTEEESEMRYQDLTADQLALLETVNMPADPTQPLDWRQKYILDACGTMTAYLDQKYPDLSYTIRGFNRSEFSIPTDRMYVLPEGGSERDEFTVFLDSEGNCTDEYAAVYARPAFDAMVVEGLEAIYGEGNVKSYSTLYQQEGADPDLSQPAQELLRSGCFLGDSVLVVNADSSDAESLLTNYLQTFADQGIPMQLSVEYATPSGFAGVNDSNIVSFCRSEEMTARYLCNSTADGQSTVRIIN